jgi:twitching motility two-component system response regulator PilH
MTTDVAAQSPTRTWRPRPEAEILDDQLRGIAAWNRARRAMEQAEGAAEATARSREMRLDLDRRMEVVRRQHEALVRRTEEQLLASARVRRTTGPARVIVVHRNEWFKDKLTEALRSSGIDVIAQLENGADGVGVAVAEQPDLLVVEDKLPMISGEEVVRQVRHFSPTTLTAVQVSYDDAVATAVEAGAHTAFPRRVPPAEVARDLRRLVGA